MHPPPPSPPLLCIHPLSDILSSIIDIDNGINSAAGSQCINTTCAPPPPPPFAVHSLSGILSSVIDVGNGVNSAAGSQCINTTWTDGSTPSSFLGTLVQSIGGYYIYLEEGIRAFVSEGGEGWGHWGLLHLEGGIRAFVSEEGCSVEGVMNVFVSEC